MLYRVVEHYDDTLCHRDYDNECFICFEYKTEKGATPINLQVQSIYINKCICKGSIHKECLTTWFDRNKTCPICRIKVFETKNNLIVIHKYIPFAIQMFTFIQINTIRVIKYMTTILFLCTLLDFYIILIKTKHDRYDEYTHDSILQDRYFNESII